MKTNLTSGRRLLKITAAISALALAICWAFGQHAEPQPNNLLAREVEWGIGRLVFARWEKGRTYPAYQMVVDSQGKPQSKEPDHWDIQLDETVEIGLRADGVLVWRKAAK